MELTEAPLAPDFRYFDQEARIPWSAIGENYTAEDVVDVIKFLIQKRDEPYEEKLAAVEKAVRELFRHGRPPAKLSLGEEVERLEARAARFLGADTCSLVTNGTAGLELGYRFANLEPGDEVIVPSNTFIATISYPLTLGAKVVFSDVDPRTLNMDPDDVARKITPRTKVIVPVHLGGWPVDMDPILRLADRHDLVVIEDAVQAFGSVYKGRSLGTLGHFGVFGFHESENITAFGEGGLVTARKPYADELRKARFLGLDPSRAIKHWVYDVAALKGKHGPVVAPNASVTELQALGLNRQMDRLEKIADQRRANARYLTERFRENPAILPQLLDTDEIQSIHHLYLLQIDPMKAGGTIQTLKRHLAARGVTQVPHFAPLYRFDLLKRLGYDAARIAPTCPVMEEAFHYRFTHLPLHPLDPDTLRALADAVLESVSEMQNT